MSFSAGNLAYDVYSNYMELDQGATVQAEYVWIGGNGELRCKTKSLDCECKSIEDYPLWNFDGSSTEQAPGENSEVYIQPIAVYPCPFRGGKNKLVLCECVVALKEDSMEMTPHPTNNRNHAVKVFDSVKDHVTWFGIEQEYTLFYADGKTPFGWPVNGYPKPQGPYYCSAGAENAFGRRIADAHYRACLYAGLKISGINAEVMCGQWEYQVGPCEGISSGDHHTMSRYILQRVCEDFGVVVSFDPKPIPGDWNGAGCHTNFSTKAMRDEGGYEHIINAIECLKVRHKEHIDAYGEGNDRRLTGAHETAHHGTFTYAVAHRGCSVRIPKTTALEKRGYLEDRRPASNMDPYIVTAMIAETTITNNKLAPVPAKPEPG